ncbi:uncharacterized protein L3040_003240 [Drepanopeziza brunnea f. sp. 'multigermtubi']|uniref:C2H2-type domain-containing protein n=1 Tax=Marssonina brunnea f. sp. multigermtubi (strain MB_m1) TaxID=1072389 RepID=K1WTW7_MARBU|nr:uncharacterized protein MBM_05913 [Drepanopeziza brunnea f. sp. 'multigermtubi' MB_m1]EKD15902.1 hypothetical protein MBM_05913 [Drepanopeziza brunnea f. sp. 'multigermtubi' MB_m1]KAJ5047413.1 hypothetical protein L3040_003240 [Drepanopeziza brunnea f. sp. 'multigermtubi']
MTGRFGDHPYQESTSIPMNESGMDPNNMIYLPAMPSSYGGDGDGDGDDGGYVSGDYWQHAFSPNAEPTHSAPFFQPHQEAFPTVGNQQKQAPIFTFNGTPFETYPPFSSSAMGMSTASTHNLAQEPQNLLASRDYRTPPTKRQRISLTGQDYGDLPASSGLREEDQDSLCGTESECCSSCSGGIPCDEPNCSPCDEEDCVGEAVELCSEKSCSKPACREECFSIAFQNQTSLDNGPKSQENALSSQNAPWSPQMVQQGMGHTRNTGVSSKVGSAAFEHSPITTPSMVGNSETPASPYHALPTSQNHVFDRHNVYANTSSDDLSGTGSLFNTSEPWANHSYGNVNTENGQEMLPCSWENCDYIGLDHDEWLTHFHMDHIDTQMKFACPIPADNCPATIDTNPMNHLQDFHHINWDFSSPAFCPATTCSPDQSFLSLEMLHNHFDMAHARPAQGSLQCRLQTCNGTEFDDPNQFLSHMQHHLQAPVSKNEEHIELLAPGGPAATELKKEALGPVNLPHLCMWKSTNGELCSFEGKDASSLQDHVKKQHLSSLGKSTGYICQWDGCRRDSNLGEKSGFSQRGKLERHMASHTGFKCSICPICQQEFSAPQALRQHILLHTGEKPWKCKHCDKRFPQQSACTIHERTHTNEKPLECNVCGKKFSESSNLAKHRKIHGEKGLHVCPISGCGKSFHRLDQLKRHALTHDKPPKDGTKRKAPRKPKKVVAAASDV